MDFRILGPLEVRDGDRQLALGGTRQRALLGLLLLHANEVVSSDRLVDELWGEAEGSKALQVAVSRLRRTAAAIRAADPSRLVVLGGLGEKMTIYLHPYLSELYRQPGFARDFDVIGVEGYAPRPRNVARILRTTRRIMRRNGDLAKPVWITEMSWATAGGRHAFVTTKRGQARRLRRAYDMLLACRNRWNLQRVYWFAHRDRPRPAGALDYWGYHNGLLTLSGRWKPAMRSFLHYLRKRLPRRGHRTTCRRAARAAGRR